VDLAFRYGVPSFETVLSGLLEELVVEGAIAAEEVEAQNPRSHELLEARLPDLALVPHDELKRMSPGRSSWSVPARPRPTPTLSFVAGCNSRIRSRKRRE
jgi:D-ribose pyranose/furanose isomerase RbsD